MPKPKDPKDGTEVYYRGGAIGEYTDAGTGGKTTGTATGTKTTENVKPTTTTTTTTSGGGGGGSGKAATTSAPSGPVTQNEYSKSEDATLSDYERAKAALDESAAAKPSWEGSAYDADIADLYAQISGRGSFSYDLQKDALWQMYKEEFGQAAKNAMRDTMGQAAALTGGYASSYGQAVGQQAYDRRMEDLMEIAPELYDRAYGRWQDEGRELNERLGLARSMADEEYGRFRDTVGDWRDERDFAAGEADTAWQHYVTERGYADSKEAEAYDRVLNYISLGYTPTAQELADAGITDAQYKTLVSAYAPKKHRSGGTSISDSELRKEYEKLQIAAQAGGKKNGTRTVDKLATAIRIGG